MEELVKYLRASVLLQIQATLDPDEVAKPEVILARAGFSHKEIAELLDKNAAAVAKAISRDRAGRKRS
jgi:DNA-directed RNA polymerase specialized sigma24 family protein